MSSEENFESIQQFVNEYKKSPLTVKEFLEKFRQSTIGDKTVRQMRLELRRELKNAKKDARLGTKDEDLLGKIEKDLTKALKRVLKPSSVSIIQEGEVIDTPNIFMSKKIGSSATVTVKGSKKQLLANIEKTESVLRVASKMNVRKFTNVKENLDVIKEKVSPRVDYTNEQAVRRPLSRSNKITQQQLVDILNILDDSKTIATRKIIYEYWDSIDKKYSENFRKELVQLKNNLLENKEKYADEIENNVSSIKAAVFEVHRNNRRLLSGKKRREIMESVNNAEKGKSGQALKDYRDKTSGKLKEKLSQIVVTLEKDATLFKEKLDKVVEALDDIEDAKFLNYIQRIPANKMNDAVSPFEAIENVLQNLIEEISTKLRTVPEVDSTGKIEYVEVKDQTSQDKSDENRKTILDRMNQQVKENEAELDDAKRELSSFNQELSDNGIDPLLMYSNYNDNTILTFTKKMNEDVVKLLEKSKMVTLQPFALKYIDDMIEAVRETIILPEKDLAFFREGEDGQKGYPLPYFYIRDTNFSDSLNPDVREEMQQKDEDFTNFINKLQEALVSLMKYEPISLKTRSSSKGSGKIGGTLNPQLGDDKNQALTDAMKPKRTQSSDLRLGLMSSSQTIEKLSEDLGKFGKIYKEYIINPFRTPKNIIVMPRHTNSILTTFLDFAQFKQSGGKTELLPMTSYRRNEKNLLTNQELDNLTTIIEFVYRNKRAKLKTNANIESALNQAVTSLKEKVALEVDEKEIARQLSIFIYSTITKDEKERVRRINVAGNTLENLIPDNVDAKDLNNRDISVLVLLRNHMAEMRIEYEKSQKRSSSRLYELLNSLFKKFNLNVVYKLLKSHDSIRKMLGKDVVYNYLPISFNSIDYFLDNNNYDLTHMEIENIIKSDNSHNNISIEYGISNEDVYLIKANFR